jgi:transposase
LLTRQSSYRECLRSRSKIRLGLSFYATHEVVTQGRGCQDLLKVGISSVKRYVAAARAGRSLASKKRPGSKPKIDETARRLLEADLKQRPAATLPQRGEILRRVGGVGVSDSTVSRMLKRMG